MADNIDVTEGSGTTLASDEIGAVQYPRVKISWGVDGAAVDASASNPLPVDVTASIPAGTNNIGDVDIASALPAGTNAIGKLAANSGVDIGDVDVTSVVPGTAATNLGKAEDAAHTTGDTGVMSLGVRSDAGTAFGADGDYVPLSIDSSGNLRVVSSGGAAGTQYDVDDAAGATDTGTLALAVRDDTLTTLTPADGDYTQLRVNSTGALHVTGGGGGTEYTEDAVAASPATGTSSLMERDDALTTVSEAAGDWIKQRGTAEGALWVQDFNSDAILADTTTVAGAVSGTEMQVDIVTSALPTGAATEATLVTIDADTSTLAGAVSGTEMQVDIVAALPAGTNNIGDVDVLSVTPGTGATDLGKAEDAAHTTADTGVAALAVRRDTAAVGSGTDGDYSTLNVNAIGQMHTAGASALQTTNMWDATTSVTPKFAAIDVASSGDNTIVAAVASKKIRVLSCVLVAGGDVDVRFESGAAGTALTGQMDLTTNSGFTLPFNPVGWFETATNTLLNVELSGAVSVDGCLTYVEVD